MSVARKLGLDLPELKDWICCGSTAAHSTNSVLADALPARNLSAAEGKTVAVACAACNSRLKTANHRISNNPTLRTRIAEVVGSDYDGRTPVSHLLEILSTSGVQ
jgi:heterodisulfide reductase subunit B